MKKLVLLIFCLFLFCLPVFAKENYYKINIANMHFICFDSGNCYNKDTYYYNKILNVYSIDMIFDLMDCDKHEIYKSPFDDGYITHLIFNTKLKNGKKYVKLKGFITGTIEEEYENNKISSMHYNYKGYYMTIPSVLPIIEKIELTKMFKNWIPLNKYQEEIKILASI